MKKYDVIYGAVPAEEIEINRNELAQRLKTDRSFEHSAIDLCIEEFNIVVDYRYAYVRVPVGFVAENTCNLGFGNIVSKNLYDNLMGCKTAFVFAITTGIGVDRLLNKLSITSQAKHFITDGIASAAAESFCDYMDNLLRNGNGIPHRFSPGYGDLALEIQPALLGMLNASKNLGITLNKSILMTPVKSITAIMGVCDEINS